MMVDDKRADTIAAGVATGRIKSDNIDFMEVLEAREMVLICREFGITPEQYRNMDAADAMSMRSVLIGMQEGRKNGDIAS